MSVTYEERAFIAENKVERLEQENAELKQQITLLSGVFSREEELQATIKDLERIIAEMRAVDSPDFEKLKELGWTFSLCEICGEALSASKPVIQEGMQLVGEMACDYRTGHIFNILWSGNAQPIGTKLYAMLNASKE